MPINKFNTNLDLARQAKIYSGETAVFQGGIEMGMPFSGFPSGVDTNTIVSIGVGTTERATFSGTSATTIFDVTNLSSPSYNPTSTTLRVFPYSEINVGSSVVTVTATTYTPLLLSYTANTGVFNNPTNLVWGNPLLEKLYNNNSSGTTYPNDYFIELFNNIGEGIVGNTIALNEKEYYQTESSNSIYSGGTFNMSIYETGTHGSFPTLVTGTTSGTVTENSATTYFWSDSQYLDETSGMTLPITTLSADSQSTDINWVLSQSTIIDGNLIGLQYTGFNVTYTFQDVTDVSTGTTPEYHGITFATRENFSAGTLDYKGDLTWLNIIGNANVVERLTVDRLTVVSGAQPDYLLKSIDTSGNMEFVALSAVTSSSCTPTINTTNIYPCVSGDPTYMNGDFTIVGNLTVSGLTTSATTIIETETVLIEDANISLNYGGDHTTASGGGITVLSGVSNSVDSTLSTDADGNWVAYPSFSAGTMSACTGIWTSAIHSCSPLMINPLDEGNVYFGSQSAVTINTQAGTGYTMEVSGNTYVYDGNFTISNDYTLNGATYLNVHGDRGNNAGDAGEVVAVIEMGTDGPAANNNFRMKLANHVNAVPITFEFNQSANNYPIMEMGNSVSGNVDVGFYGNTTVSGDTYVSGNTNLTTLNINTLGGGASINNLGIDTNGNVVVGGGGAGSVGGTGTTNTITKWLTSTGLTDSNILDDGTDVTIKSNLKVTGTTYSPTYSGDAVTAVYYGDGSNLSGVGGGADPASATTTTIDFTGQTIYYDSVTPSSATVFTNNLTGAKLGLIQKIYSNAASEPTYPAGWVLMGDAIYFTSTLNIIYAEWGAGSRVEYWYVQEQ